jgi:hypothetical protein
MQEFTLKLPNAKAFDALDKIVESDADPALRALAVVVRELADSIIVLSKIVVSANSGITATRDTDGITGEQAG